LIEFQVGKPASVDADLGAALAIFRELDDVPGISLAHSFYAEVAAARGDIDEGRRRRLALLDHYLGLPDTTFVIAARAYSRAKLGGLDGDLELSERCYREAADGFSRIERPMMLAMTRGIIADFDERAGDYRAAIDNLDRAIATNDELGLRGFNGSLSARLGWALLQDGDVARSEVAYDRALDLARRLSNTPVVFLALAGRSVVHRLDGRNASAAEAAIEALDLYLAGEPRRLANRVDPRADQLAGAAVCCTELGILGIEAGDVEHAVQLLGQAERLRSDVGVPVPRFECDGLERAVEAASSLLGPARFQAAFDLGRAGQLGDSVMFRR
jgi:tetratricopeptide (TPR) repeat protein